MTQPEGRQGWALSVVYASQSFLWGDSVLVFLPFVYTPGKNPAGYVTCVPFPLPAACLLSVHLSVRTEESEVQHLLSTKQDGL